MALGETQEQFARRLGRSVVSIAKYETNNSRPGVDLLNDMAKLADARGLKDEALAFRKEFIPYLSWTPEERRRHNLTTAFHKFIQNPDTKRLRAMERLLAPELEKYTLAELDPKN
jgi:transcriptional regulator with XRE-family HTH domain